MSSLAERVGHSVHAIHEKVRNASVDRKEKMDEVKTHARGLEGDLARKGKGIAHEDAIEHLVHKTKDTSIKHTDDKPWLDVEIQFIGASKLPKMDVVGSADPYFVAKIGNSTLSFVSTVKPDTLTPVWNEIWRLKNVPVGATLNVEVFDKDNGAPHDDYIGKFHVGIQEPGAKEAEIEGPLFRKNRGTFWLKIVNKPSKPTRRDSAYIFDGPIRFSRHFSPTIGRLTANNNNNHNANSQRLYSTWKLYLRGVPMFFDDRYQHWNEKYKAAQSIFGPGPGSYAVRSGIQAGHRMLYARSTTNGFGILGESENGKDAQGLLSVLTALNSVGGTEVDSATQGKERIKPAVYTYIISAVDDSFRFSETGAAFFVDFASKHALHANCATQVRYSGEFHPRPKGGWENYSDWRSDGSETSDEEVEWELVIDNNSGTYAPDPMGLGDLKELLEYNFTGEANGVGSKLSIVTMPHEDERLGQSVAACRKYALEHRGVHPEDLTPHLPEDGSTLFQRASVKASDIINGGKDTGEPENI